MPLGNSKGEVTNLFIPNLDASVSSCKFGVGVQERCLDWKWRFGSCVFALRLSLHSCSHAVTQLLRSDSTVFSPRPYPVGCSVCILWINSLNLSSLLHFQGHCLSSGPHYSAHDYLKFSLLHYVLLLYSFLTLSLTHRGFRHLSSPICRSLQLLPFSYRESVLLLSPVQSPSLTQRTLCFCGFLALSAVVSPLPESIRLLQ